MRIKKSGNGRMCLRERLAWLLRALRTGNYGAISTRNITLTADYCAATGAHMDVRGSECRSKQLNKDMGELCERGLLSRSWDTQHGTTLSFYVYTMTEKGEREADKLVERSDECETEA